MKCEICGYDTENRQSFNSHITHKHKMKSKEYYDKFLKSNNDGICLTCGNPTNFRNMWYGYNKHCSTKCIPLDKDVQIRMKQTCLQKYGTEYSSQSESVKQKIRTTTYNHYGVSCYLQTEQCRQRCIEITSSDTIKEKIQQTNLSKYGVRYSFQAEEVKNKIMKTINQRYGVDNIAQHSEFRKKALRTAQSNGKRSRLERLFEDLCVKYNIHYISEYKDELYPYHCDFYLPETKTYIEIHGYWVHGKHFFGTQKEDTAILDKWKEKSKTNPHYLTAINTWSIIDVEKKNTAEKNNIQYVVLWSKQDIENYFVEIIQE